MHKSGKNILLVFAVIIICAAIYRLAFPSLNSRLVNTSWCVDNIYYNGRRMGPHTLHAIYIVLKGKKSCTDQISFMDEGEIQLPGLNTRAIEGTWQTDKDKHLQINVDTLQNIYQGTYEEEISGDSLMLQSKTTLLRAHKQVL